MKPINIYCGVRVSEREANLLQARLDAKRIGRSLPESLKSRAEWLHEACLRMSEGKRP